MPEIKGSPDLREPVYPLSQVQRLAASPPSEVSLGKAAKHGQKIGSKRIHTAILSEFPPGPFRRLARERGRKGSLGSGDDGSGQMTLMAKPFVLDLLESSDPPLFPRVPSGFRKVCAGRTIRQGWLP